MPDVDPELLRRLDRAFDDISDLQKASSAQQTLADYMREKLETIDKKLDDRLAALDDKLSTRSQAGTQIIRWAVTTAGTIVSALVMAAAFYVQILIGPIGKTADLNTEAIHQLGNQVSTLSQASANSTDHDIASQTDRSQLNFRMEKIETALAREVADRREQSAAFDVHLIEIETQNGSIYNLANLTKAETQKTLSLLWQKVFPGMQYPDDNYYPRSTVVPNDASGSNGGK